MSRLDMDFSKRCFGWSSWPGVELCCQHGVPLCGFQFPRNFPIKGEILTHWEERHVNKWVCPHHVLVHRSEDVGYTEPLSIWNYHIHTETNPTILEATIAKATSQMVIATNFIDPGLFWYIFRHVDIWLRSTATNFIDPGPLNYTSATTWIPPRPSTLDALFPSMVNAASSTVEISHPMTDPSSLVDLHSCSLVEPSSRTVCLFAS